MSLPLTSGGSNGFPKAPSDQELMLFVDGELEAGRALEIEAFLQRDARGQAIVTGLRLAGGLIGSEAVHYAEASGGDTIADHVMDAIDAEASRRLIAPARKAPAWRAPAATAAGLAFAFAAAWMVFFRDTAFHLPVLNGHSAVARLVAPPVDEPSDDDATGASFAVVDFGARPGTIFYVPSSEGESAMAVVWLTDDDSSPASGEGR